MSLRKDHHFIRHEFDARRLRWKLKTLGTIFLFPATSSILFHKYVIRNEAAVIIRGEYPSRFAVSFCAWPLMALSFNIGEVT
jgi:hypothetical protein